MNTVSDKILVSVVMATYNGQEFLGRQLKSILGQSHSNLEIIICDDASLDDTQKIIQSFAENDGRIKYYFNKINTGVNKNFESGFLKAAGSFIAIADQDDVWKKNKIEEQMKLFTGDNIILVHSASALFSNNNLPIHKIEAKATKPMTGNDSRRLLIRNSISGHNIIFRKILLQHIIPFPGTVYYDWWLCEVATCFGAIAATNKILAYQRQHNNNLTVYNRTTAKQTLKEYIERKKALETFITISSLPPKARSFAQKLLQKFSSLEHSIFSFGLFFFLFKNASVLFFYKKKMFPFFSYIKTAYRMSFAVKD